MIWKAFEMQNARPITEDAWPLSDHFPEQAVLNYPQKLKGYLNVMSKLIQNNIAFQLFRITVISK